MLSSSERQDQCLASGGAVILLLILDSEVGLEVSPPCNTTNLYVLDTCVQCFITLMSKLMH